MSLRTAVIGVGSLGRQHARIHADLAAEGLSQFVSVCDLNESTARTVGTERRINWTSKWHELIGKLPAAFWKRASTFWLKSQYRGPLKKRIE